MRAKQQSTSPLKDVFKSCPFFVVSVFRGIVIGVLQNYRLNDKINFSSADATSIDGTDNSCTKYEVTFLPTDIQQSHPDGFSKGV